MFAFALALGAIAGGAALTYLYDRDSVLWARLCAGVCTGFAALGLIGFLFASVLGMSGLAVALAGVAATAPVLVLIRVKRSVTWERPPAAAAATYAVVALLLWFVCAGAAYETDAGISTSFDANIGDLPFHVAIINGFVHGDNFPPEHPEFAGVPLTYPFIADFLTAMFITAGASLPSALFWQNYLTLLALTGLLHRWALKLAGDRLAAVVTILLIVFSGGFGFVTLLREAAYGPGITGLIGSLPHDYTVGLTGYRWPGALSALFVPQRGFPLGLALAVLVWTLRPSAAAGVIAGLIPLVHAHTFGVVMLVAAVPGVVDRAALRPVVKFFMAALALAAPQLLFAAWGSAVEGTAFIAWQPGWDHGGQNILWFWLKNTGVFIPLLIAALFMVPKRMLNVYLPFALCFLIPNLFRLSPWIWDNVKVLFYWWVGSAPLVAIVLVRIFRFNRPLGVSLLAIQIASGGLDAWRGASRAVEHRTFDRGAIRFAELMRRQTPAEALILHAPGYNDPVYLTGRRTMVGYDGHLWSHGLDYGPRMDELKRIYSGADDAHELIAKNGVDYIVLGPLERSQLAGSDAVFSRYPIIGTESGYTLYKVER